MLISLARLMHGYSDVGWKSAGKQDVVEAATHQAAHAGRDSCVSTVMSAGQRMARGARENAMGLGMALRGGLRAVHSIDFHGRLGPPRAWRIKLNTALRGK